MPVLQGASVTIKPVLPGDQEPLKRIRATPEVARWWNPAEAEWPLDEKPDSARFAVWFEGSTVGFVQFYEENSPYFRSASLDLFIDPQFHRRGLGTDVIQTVIAYLTDERGHHRITIDPAADNTAAIRCYQNAGFRTIGTMKRYWRDHHTGEWRDGLFMELVIDLDGPADA